MSATSGNDSSGQPKSWVDLQKWLRSPCCRQPLEVAGEHAKCSQCQTLYHQEGGILILLPPQPQSL